MTFFRSCAAEAARHVKIYDPRKNEDFRFGPYANGSFVSSAASDMVIVHVPPSIEILSASNSKIRRAALQSFDLEHGVGFACTFAAPADIEAVLPNNATRCGQGCLSHFSPSQDNFERCVSWLERMKFGEFTFGCLTRFPFASDSPNQLGSRQEDFDLLFIASKLQDVEWFVSFYADTGESLIAAKSGPRTEAFLALIT